MTKRLQELRAWVESVKDEPSAHLNITREHAIEMIDLAQRCIDAEHDKRVFRQTLEKLGTRVYELEEERAYLQDQLKKTTQLEAFNVVLRMLRAEATDPGAAKNYVEMRVNWDEALAPGLPFRKAAITFFREGAKSPGGLVAEALAARNEALDLLEKFVPDPGPLSPPSEGKPRTEAHDRADALARAKHLRKIPDANPGTGRIE
jgi:hypothetical protein